MHAAAAGVIPCRHQPGRNVAQGCVTAAVETVLHGSCAAGVLCVRCVTPDYQRVTRRPPRSVLEVHAAPAHQYASRRFNIVQTLFRFTCTASHSSHTIPSTPPPTPPERAQTSTQLHQPCHAHSATPCIAEHWMEDLAIDSLGSGDLKRESKRERGQHLCSLLTRLGHLVRVALRLFKNTRNQCGRQTMAELSAVRSSPAGSDVGPDGADALTA